MKPATEEFDRLLDGARSFAALHETFRPADALSAANGGSLPGDPQLVARLLAALRSSCTEVGSAATGATLWTLRPNARRKMLSGAARDAIAASGISSPIRDALTGAGDYAPERIDALLAGEAEFDALVQIGAMLEHAGPEAPGYGRLIRIRSLLNTAISERRADDLLAGGFVGREAELARLADWIAAPQTSAPLRALHVAGIGGIGKSFLLERAIQMSRERHWPILIRLDFDRSGLNVLDRRSFFDEVSRQVGDALPDMASELRDRRLKSAQARAREKGREARYALPRELLAAMAEAVAASGRMVLVALDTLEVLRSDGETHVMSLFQHLDALAEAGIAPIQVVSAGRGDALDPVPERLEGAPIDLAGLEPAAAQAFLEARGVPERHWQQIDALARGNPLLLMLAAKAVSAGDFDAGEIPDGATAETIGGYLYRAILSRVPPALREIANEGLILRRMNAETLRQVVAPALGRELGAVEAAAMLDTLCRHHWLVETESGGWVRHRSDVRRAFLPLIYAARPAETAAINRRAADWYRDPSAGHNAFEALYHRLQLTRAGEPLAEVPNAQALLFDDLTLEELPAEARDAVRHAQGRRSDFGRSGAAEPEAKRAPDSGDLAAAAPTGEGPTRWMRYDPAGRRLVVSDPAPSPPGEVPDSRAVDDLELMLKRVDLREGGFILEKALRGWFAPGSRAGQLVMCYFWLVGRWSSARRLYDAQPPGALAAALGEMRLVQGRVLLEMTAEFKFDALVAALRDPAMLEPALTLRRESARFGLDGAALDFALLCALDGPESYPADLDLARGLIAPHAEHDPSARDRTRREADLTREKYRVQIEPGTGGGVDESRDLAVLSPYAVPINAFVYDEPTERLAAWLVAADDLVPGAAAEFAPQLAGTERVRETSGQQPPGVAEAFRALGLTAEWALGFTQVHRIPEFPSLARAAERWRRAVAGDWPYGRTRPKGWVGAPDTDRVTRDRAFALLDRPDPLAAAEAQLLFWARPLLSPAEACARLTTRYGARADAALALAPEAPSGTVRREDLPPILHALHRSGVDSVIAAPLAVILAHGRRLQDIVIWDHPIETFIPSTELPT